MQPELIEPGNKTNYATLHNQGGDTSLLSIDKQYIIDIYKEYGAVLFRGFKMTGPTFYALASQFCTNFIINNDKDRDFVSPDRRIQTVNLGSVSFPLHPEMAMLPTRPDIAWFACKSPPTIGGETMLCDGISIVKALQKETRALLESRSFLYKTKTTKQECEAWLNIKDPDAEKLVAMQDTTSLNFTIEDGEFYSTYITPAIYKPLFSDEPAFGSFLLFARGMQGWRHFPVFEDSTEVPDSVYDELKRVSDALTCAHTWQKHDVLMVDNSRFMHGRHIVYKNRERVIWTQFGYVSFLPDMEARLKAEQWRQPRISEVTA